MTLPKKVTLVEVGPRDGLQNEQKNLSVQDKVNLINQLSNAGLSVIEVGSFVSPKWVPQMADSAKVYQKIIKRPGTRYSMLVPNLKGLDAAIDNHLKDIAIFAAASETFSEKNINCTIAESLTRYREVIKRATEHQMKIRGYVSCVLGCPYEGQISPSAVLKVTEQLLEMGCYEVSLGDTIGIGSAGTTQKLLDALLQKLAPEKLAVHFHNTYGQALVNIYVALQNGISTIDSSIGGLGGCPYAPGASGNVATEDVLYMLDSLGIETGVNLKNLLEITEFIQTALQLPVRSSQPHHRGE